MDNGGDRGGVCVDDRGGWCVDSGGDKGVWCASGVLVLHACPVPPLSHSSRHLCDPLVLGIERDLEPPCDVYMERVYGAHGACACA